MVMNQLASSFSNDLVDLGVSKMPSLARTPAWFRIRLCTRASELAHWPPAAVNSHVERPAVTRLADEDLIVRDFGFGDCEIGLKCQQEQILARSNRTQSLIGEGV